MQGLNTLITDLTRLTKGRSKEDRANAFGRVAELYFASLDLQEGEHVAFFDHVLGLLVDDVDTVERGAFSKRIAPLKRAPTKLIRRLANDDEIAVAEPVISQSEQLTSEDLTMLAQMKGQPHLLAIGGRGELDAAITDVLVARGEREVVRRVAKNPGAEFNADCFARLAQKAQSDDLLAEIVSARPDIPANVLRAIISHAADDLRARILAAADPERKRAIESLFGPAPASAGGRDYAPARTLVMDRCNGSKIGERELVEFASAKKFEETVVALGMLTATPVDIIERFMDHNPAEAMPVLCKAAGLSWQAAEAVLSLCSAIPEAQKKEMLRQALANYSKLTRPTSEKLLRFWFVRGTSANGAHKPEAEQRPMIERRKKDKRRKVNLPAVLAADGIQMTMCTILDLSMGGAKIGLPPSFEVPDRFSLGLSANSSTWRQCEVRWRSGSSVGVQFRS